MSAPAAAAGEDVLRLQLGPPALRAPFKPHLLQIKRQATAIGDLAALCTAFGPIQVMLPKKWVPKAYPNNDETAYSLYTDFAYRDASGSYTKLYVTVTGVVEALQDRLDKRGRSITTMRLRLATDDHEQLEEVATHYQQVLAQLESRVRMQAVASDKRSQLRHHMRCTYTETEVAIPDAAWLDYLAGDICALSVDDAGAVMRPPAWFKKRPVNTPAYEGLPVRVVCELGGVVTAPLAKVPQPRATLRLKLTPHMLVFLGEEPRRTSEISVDDLGLVMADDAPSDDDDPEPAAPPPPPSKRARRSREARASTPDSDYSSDDDL